MKSEQSPDAGIQSAKPAAIDTELAPGDGHHLQPWWRPLALAENSAWHYQVGPLHIYLARQHQEWWLASETLEEVDTTSRVLSEAVAQLPSHLQAARYVFRQAPDSFALKPRLLDRPVVVKAKQPVFVPPGEAVEFFISSPVCVEVSVQSSMPVPAGSVSVQQLPLILQELVSVRLSDTWFGPSTQEGELCYAARTQARRLLAELPHRPYRVTTPVVVNNESAQPLAVDKLSIPVPCLAVFGRDDGSLWTQPVTLRHTGVGTLAAFTIGRPVAGAQLLNEARVPMQKNGLVRAFASLFGD